MTNLQYLNVTDELKYAIECGVKIEYKILEDGSIQAVWANGQCVEIISVDIIEEIKTHRIETVRAELEKHYTHVTFVKHNDILGYSYWTIGEDAEEVITTNNQKLEELAGHIETLAVVDAMKAGTVITGRVADKLAYFKQCIVRGLVKADRKLYKKMTARQLEDLLITADRKQK